jgi:P-type Cu+ transporter
MALEPRTVTAGEEENAELRNMRLRFWVALALTVPLAVISMGHLIPGHPLQRLASSHFWGWVELGLAALVALAVMIESGYRLAKRESRLHA